jgi:hypothetical protein
MNGKVKNSLVVWSFVSEQVGKGVFSSRVYLHFISRTVEGYSQPPVKIFTTGKGAVVLSLRM